MIMFKSCAENKIIKRRLNRLRYKKMEGKLIYNFNYNKKIIL